MKRYLQILSLAGLAALAACSSGQTVETPTTAETQVVEADTSQQPTFEVPASDQLLIGTLMLEDSELAVTHEQATQLLPLWQLMKSLAESDTTVQAEINAVLKQINQQMTAEQLAQIQTMDFSGQSMFQVLQDLGVSSNLPEGFDPANVPDDFQPGSMRPDVPGLGPGAGQGSGAGPGAGLGGEGITPEMMATRQANMQANGGGVQRRSNVALMNALIERLQLRAAGTG